MKRKWMWIAPLALIGFALFISLGGYAVMSLWNWLLPPMFGWHALTFWQALGILVLSRLLFGGFAMHGGPRSRMGEGFRARMRNRMHGRLEERMEEHFAAMTPDERERFRQRMRDKFGFGPSGGAPQS